MSLAVLRGSIIIVAGGLQRRFLERFKMSTVSFTAGQKDRSAGNVNVSKMSAARQAVDKHVEVRTTNALRDD